MIHSLLAKSTPPVSLVKHGFDVSELSEHILKSMGVDAIYNKHLKTTKITALLHDIGKCTLVFQNLLHNKKSENKNKFLHNEIGWAFIIHYLKLHKHEVTKIANNIYWHHGINNEMFKHKSVEILNSLTTDDINMMCVYLKHILGEEYLRTDFDVSDSIISPSYYTYIKEETWDSNIEKNSEFLILHTCLISADRLVSANKTKDDIDKITLKSKSLNLNDLNLTLYDGKRLDVQKSILNDTEKTTLVKAPAGFGKTLLGLFWNFRSDKKLIWVCPRNMVAMSVYDSIIKEFNTMDIKDISVELFLTNEVKESTHTTNGFESDIIITNIDNYLKPCINNGVSDKLYFISNCDVIFDEFHELESDEALFACFVTIMRMRNLYTSSKTLLLSATQTMMNFSWENNFKKTTILPNTEEHYSPAHDKLYDFSTIELSNIDLIKEHVKADSSTLVKTNSISNAQRMKHILNIKHLFHSDFESYTKKKYFSFLLDYYGKKSERSIDKNNVVSTHILQSSLDISFNNIFEICLSPESTLQLWGRCNRWGDYVSSKFVSFNIANNMSESTTVKNLYDSELNKLWFKELMKYKDTQMDLKQLYVIYNNFNKTYYDKIKTYLINKILGSVKNSSFICPKKINDYDKNDIIISGGNKLRTSTKTCFITAKKHNSDENCEPFSVNIRNNFEEFDGQDLVYAQMKLNQFIRNNKDPRFDYSSLMKGKPSDVKKKPILIDNIRKNAIKSNMPYPIINKVYHEDYGLIDISKIKEYNL